jgi:hypothetical protein
LLLLPQQPTSLSPAFEILQLYWGAHDHRDRAPEQEIGDIIRNARIVLRPGNGMLIGAAVIQQTELANLVLQKIETMARGIFGEKHVYTYPAANTSKP